MNIAASVVHVVAVMTVIIVIISLNFKTFFNKTFFSNYFFHQLSVNPWHSGPEYSEVQSMTLHRNLFFTSALVLVLIVMHTKSVIPSVHFNVNELLTIGVFVVMVTNTKSFK